MSYLRMGRGFGALKKGTGVILGGTGIQAQTAIFDAEIMKTTRPTASLSGALLKVGTPSLSFDSTIQGQVVLNTEILPPLLFDAILDRPDTFFDFTGGSLDNQWTFVRSSTATFVRSDGDIGLATVDQPRFTYDISTGTSYGILVEGARTNMILNSKMWSGTASMTNWVNAVSGIRSGTVSMLGSYDGSFAQNQIAVATRPMLQQALTVTELTDYSWSMWFEAASGVSTERIMALSTISVTPDWDRNISEIAVGNAPWYGNLSFNTNTGVTTYSPRIGMGTQGNSTGTVQFSRVQVEQAAFPSSYIPSDTSATATRAADRPTITPTALQYNQTQGAFVLQARTPRYATVSGLNTQTLLQADDGSAGNRITVSRNAQNEIRLRVVDDDNEQCDLNAGTVASNTNFRVAFSYNTNDIRVVLDNGTATGVTTATLPTISMIRLGHDHAGNEWWSTVAEMQYYGTAKTNAELGAQTTSELTLPRTFYGTRYGDAVGNIVISSTKVSYRFRCRHTGNVTGIRWYIILGSGNSTAGNGTCMTGGYGAGDGGIINIDIHANDPTNSGGQLVNHPVATPLQASSAATDSGFAPSAGELCPSGSDAAGRLDTFAQPIPLVAGNIYHIVFSNTHASPGSNYYSIDTTWLHFNTTPFSPFEPDAHSGVIRTSGGAWTVDRSNVATPLFELIFDDGFKQGQTHGSEANGTSTVGGANQIRQTFCPQEGNITANFLGWRLARNGVSDVTAVFAKQSDGSVMQTLSCSATLWPAGTTATEGRFGGKAMTPITFSVSTTYTVTLSALSGSTFYARHARDATTTWGYAGLGFDNSPRGGAFASSNSGGTFSSVGGGSSNPTSDFQFYFLLQ